MPIQLNTSSQPSVSQGRSGLGTQTSTNTAKTPPRVQRKSVTQTLLGVQTRRAANNSVMTRSATKSSIGLQRITKKK